MSVAYYVRGLTFWADNSCWEACGCFLAVDCSVVLALAERHLIACTFHSTHSHLCHITAVPIPRFLGKHATQTNTERWWLQFIMKRLSVKFIRLIPTDLHGKHAIFKCYFHNYLKIVKYYASNTRRAGHFTLHSQALKAERFQRAKNTLVDTRPNCHDNNVTTEKIYIYISKYNLNIISIINLFWCNITRSHLINK